MRKLVVLLVLSLLVATSVTGQDPNSTQKLLKQIQTAPDDNTKVDRMLDLCLVYIRKPDENPLDLDSAILLAAQAEKISGRAGYSKGTGDSYRYRYYAYNEKGQKQTAKEFIEKAVAVYKQHDFFTELGESYHALGTCFPADSDSTLQIRIRWENEALKAYQKTSHTLNQAGSCRQLGELYQIAYDLPNSIKYLKQSLSLYQENKYKELHGIYDLISQHYRLVGDFEEAIKYGLLAVKTAEAIRDTTLQMATIYNRLGLSYYAFNDFHSSKKYTQKALDVARKFRDQQGINIIVPNVAMTLNRLNEPESAVRLLQEVIKSNPPKGINEMISFDCLFVMSYLTMHRSDLARPYLQKLLERENARGVNSLTRRRMYAVIIDGHLAEKNFNVAAIYLNKLQIHPDLEIKELINIEFWGFKIDSAAGKYLSAIDHYQKYKAINDSAFTESRARQIEQLKVEYETDKKDQDLQLKEKDIRLLTNERDLQQAMLTRARFTKNLILVGSILLLFVVGVLYSRYRIKQKSAFRLEQKQKEINQQNDTLKKLVTEKEWLLKEVHHRVKNNLQIVMSLLNSQSAFLTDKAAVTAIKDSQNRVNSISLIHQKLYQSENISTIDMQQYITDMVNYLRIACNTGNNIRFEMDCDPVHLDVTQVVPLGLILNEAITNAIKYAFPDGKGIISISLHKAEDDQLVLTIADNGVGMAGSINSAEVKSLGMSLLTGLTEDIDGHFSIESTDGVSVKVTFRKEPPPPMHDASIVDKSIPE
jgi:two-component sensor histidine kinase/tetratricopeptide (TPR) repeat protein